MQKLRDLELTDLHFENGFQLVAVLAGESPLRLSISCVLHSNIDDFSSICKNCGTED